MEVDQNQPKVSRAELAAEVESLKEKLKEARAEIRRLKAKPKEEKE